MKRVISIALALTLCLSMPPTPTAYSQSMPDLSDIDPEMSKYIDVEMLKNSLQTLRKAGITEGTAELEALINQLTGA